MSLIKCYYYIEYILFNYLINQILVFFCGLEGYEEFFEKKWLIQILSWQNPHGCYQSTAQLSPRVKRTSNVIDYGCSDHTTGLGMATISLYLNYLLYLKYKLRVTVKD